MCKVFKFIRDLSAKFLNLLGSTCQVFKFILDLPSKFWNLYEN